MALNGKNGKVLVDSAEVADITRWSLNQTHEPAAYKSSGTSGATKRLAGYTDWSASFDFIMPAGGKPANFAIGQSVTLTLELTTGKTYVGTGFVDELAVDDDVAGPAPITGRATVHGDGAITPPA